MIKVCNLCKEGFEANVSTYPITETKYKAKNGKLTTVYDFDDYCLVNKCNEKHEGLVRYGRPMLSIEGILEISFEDLTEEEKEFYNNIENDRKDKDQ